MNHNNIYSIINRLTNVAGEEQNADQSNKSTIDTSGTITENMMTIEQRLKEKLAKHKNTCNEGDVCPECDSVPCQCETTKEGIEDVPTFMRDKAGQPRLTMKDIKKPSAYQFRVGEKEFMSLGAAKEFAAGTGQQVEKIEEADRKMSPVTIDPKQTFHGIKDKALLKDMINDARVMDYDEFHDEYSRHLNDPYEFWENYHDEESVDDMEEGNEFSGEEAGSAGNQPETFVTDKGNRYTYVLGDDEMKAQIMFNGTEIHLQYDPNMQAFDPQESRAKDPILDKWLKRQQPFGSDEDSMDDFVDRAVGHVPRGPGMEEGNEFSGALAKAKAAGAEEFEVDGKKYKVKEDWMDFQAKKDLYKKQGADVEGRDNDYVVTFADGTRKRYQDKDGRRVVTSLEPVDKGEPTDAEGNVIKRGRGRPKGAKRALGAKGPTGRSKLLKMSEDVSSLERSLTEDHALREEVFNHIVGRFPYEVKQFREASTLDENLYDALYDYYFEDMPYNVKKGRSCDPREWVAERFMGDIGVVVNEEPINTIDMEPTMELDLNELARLAGLDVKAQVTENCMGITAPSQEQNNISVSTSFNAADGKKTLNVNADGESAEMLAQLLKLSGLMGGEPAKIVVSDPTHTEEQVEEADRDPEYANTPDEKTAGIDAAVPSGNDLHRAKGANPNWHGDNPMKTAQFEETDPIAKLGRELMAEYESIKVAK